VTLLAGTAFARPAAGEFHESKIDCYRIGSAFIRFGTGLGGFGEDQRLVLGYLFIQPFGYQAPGWI
jgi:hypothetical protein